MKKLILIMGALFSMRVMSCGKGAGQSSTSDSVDTAQVDTIDSVQADTVAADSLVK